MFSDWSDGSEVNALDKPDGAPRTEEKQEKSKDVKVKDEEDKVDDGSFEDVYDPISDDELEAIIADGKQESKVKEKTQTLDIEDVDWSVLERKSEKGKSIIVYHVWLGKAGLHFQRFCDHSRNFAWVNSKL